MPVERIFQVGDICKIREWDDMEQEFGLTEWGAIRTGSASFPNNMRYLCGKRFTVSGVPENGRSTYNSEEGVEGTPTGQWIITANMLEYAEDEEIEDDSYVYSEEDIINILEK